MKRAVLISVFLAVLFIAGPCSEADAEMFDINIFAGGAYTAIDMPEALGVLEDYFVTWDQVNWKIIGQVIYKVNPVFGIGVEGGYNRLYYYYYKIPVGPFYSYYERLVDPISIGGVFHFDLSDMVFAQLGVSFYFFQEGITPGFPINLGFDFPVNEYLSFSIVQRIEIILGDGTPITIGGMSGMRIKL